MNSINADLHCHSIVSDGTLTPEDLAQRAHANGVQIWSLTDHDELGGQDRAAQAAKNLGVSYIPGVEISVSWVGHTVHIVGLGIDHHNQTLFQGLKKTRDGRANRAQEIAAGLAKAGIHGAYEGALQFVSNMELISRTHFARFLVEAGVCKDTDEVFANYLVDGKPGYVPHVWATLDEAVTWITQAGGSHHPDEYQIFAKVAMQYGFLASRGSDFHDPHESGVDLGMLPPLPSQLRPVWSVFQ